MPIIDASEHMRDRHTARVAEGSFRAHPVVPSERYPNSVVSSFVDAAFKS
jgi:hypothetical protein